MAYQDYRPEYEYLWGLGFIETDNGGNHPYERWNELKLNDKSILHMDAFWDFQVEPFTDASPIPICFSCDEELEDFIKAFRN
ncbi:hypothetical protein D0T84_00970 [Dysgonomonas sp. 521]|uniref:hypothetical protein n=1 Tax=Dysgonomonas sp. 521 TaxID=2302932 RepID=UPI0013D81244|nr:hypothetical protein [Dysgonomonas sp. 521]NDV93490.1 hypothetical protein [Dysgonomonas sp. 521]